MYTILHYPTLPYTALPAFEESLGLGYVLLEPPFQSFQHHSDLRTAHRNLDSGVVCELLDIAVLGVSYLT